jgi:glycosyltransferase involved in cell wall biosynthesis/lysophospholipase L1-like esterase
MRPLRVIYVIGELGVGGAERQVLELAARLDRDAFSPLVCSIHAGHPFAEAFRSRKVPLLELPRRGSFDLGRLVRLRRLIRVEQPAIVHTFLTAPSLYGRLACLGLRRRPVVVVSERSIATRLGPLLGTAERALYPLADCFVANAEAVRAALVRRLHPLRPRIEVIYNGFDASASGSGRTREEVRGELGWTRGETVLLAVGRLVWEKDYRTLFEAVARLGHRPGLRVAIAGDGPERAALEKLLAERRLPITLLGTRSDVPDLMRAADCFVLSSCVEGFPNVVGEALLAGLPVVATAAGGVPEILRDGVDGRLVPVGDPARLAEAVASVLDDPEAAQRAAAAGARRIRETFTADAMVRRSEELYRALLSSRARPAVARDERGSERSCGRGAARGGNLGKHSMRARASGLLLLIASLGACLLVGEIAARLLLPPHPLYRHPQPQHDAHPTLGWVLRPSQRSYTHLEPMRSNAAGLRDDEELPLPPPLGERRILVLGDSVAFGNGVPTAETFAEVLEGLLRARGLPVRVLNAGVQGYSVHQEADFLRARGLSFEPELVLVAFYENDVLIREPPGERTAMGGPNEGARLLPPSFLYLVKRLRSVVFLGRLVREVRWRWLPPGDDYHLGALFRDEPTAESERAWRDVRDSLASIREEARSAGKRALLAVFPHPSQMQEGVLDHTYRARILEVAREVGIEAFDLLPALRALGPRNPFLAFDGHLNALGHRVAAQALAEPVARLLALPNPEASPRKTAMPDRMQWPRTLPR